MDQIALHGIRAFGRHGANSGERDAEQSFDVDVVLDVDLHVAQVNDELADTLNYAALHASLVGIVQSTSFRLIESLAGALLKAIFSDVRIAHAEVTVAKPNILDGATPSVTLARNNPRYRETFS